MKTIREIIAEYIPNEDISTEMVDKLYEYKNQRVIDELQKLKDNYIDLWELTDDLDNRIEELKQQIWKEHTKQSSGYSKDILRTMSILYGYGKKITSPVSTVNMQEMKEYILQANY